MPFSSELKQSTKSLRNTNVWNNTLALVFSLPLFFSLCLSPSLCLSLSPSLSFSLCLSPSLSVSLLSLSPSFSWVWSFAYFEMKTKYDHSSSVLLWYHGRTSHKDDFTRHITKLSQCMWLMLNFCKLRNHIDIVHGMSHGSLCMSLASCKN